MVTKNGVKRTFWRLFPRPPEFQEPIKTLAERISKVYCYLRNSTPRIVLDVVKFIRQKIASCFVSVRTWNVVDRFWPWRILHGGWGVS